MALSKKIAGRVTVVSVDIDGSEKQQVVKRWATRFKAPFSVVYGGDGVAQNYKVENIPTNVVIAPGGKIVYAAEGFDQAAIEGALKELQSPPAAAKRNLHPARAHTRRVAMQALPGGSSLSENVAPFKDVPPDHWAAAAVELLHRRGIVIGYPPQ